MRSNASIFVTDDVIAPQPVTGLTAMPVLDAGAWKIELNWTPPADPDLQGVRILRRTDTFPQSETDTAADRLWCRHQRPRRRGAKLGRFRSRGLDIISGIACRDSL